MAAAGVEEHVDLVVGTLGKALGSYGAYVCCSKRMSKFLVNTARTFIFSTAPAPPSVAGAMAALELLREQPRRVEKLQRNAVLLREALAEEGLEGVPGHTQILPLLIGDAAAASKAQRAAAGARGLRTGHPAADGARGHLAPAAHGDVLAHEVRAA